VLLICDEIQTGCWRTGSFFGFEPSSVVPDLITVSKSISGLGLPLSLLLLRPGLDVWYPGEHTGTFRANQLALVAAVAGLRLFKDPGFLTHAAAVADRLQQRVAEIGRRHPAIDTRGRGAVAALDLARAGGFVRANAVQRRCFDHGVIFELSGRGDSVIKLMPALTIELTTLEGALDILDDELLLDDL
jgi:diaminobutyrate-2-oxoglutarate transaminase